ncbi:MAG: hypothetical protein NTY14_03360 [Candidatus Omnitrophica bacterium]|nr:hypothetical protein [Candidatus Omnitrophota bacterium]
MKNRGKLISLALGIFVLLFPIMARAEFSAVIKSTNKGKVFQSRIFVGKDRTRMTSDEGIIITRMDQNVVWILMPKEKMYMEQAFDPTKAVATQEKVEGEIERKLVGHEMIDDRSTDKYKVVFIRNNKKEIMFQWMTNGIDVPVKMAAGDNSWIVEYKDIRPGKQANSLFEVPYGYQKVAAGMPSMKDMFKGIAK